MAKLKKQKRETFWTKAKVAWLRKYFPSNSTAWCANMLCYPLASVKKKASRLGLKKTKKYMRALGRA